jgi:integrase
MTATKLNFAKRALEALPTTGKRYYVHDSRVRGLALYVTSTGVKTFLLYRKVNGAPVKLKIGRLEDLSIEQARNKAEELNNQIALGQNPQEEAQEKRQELTFAAFFPVYMERHATPYKKTARFDEDIFRLHLKEPLASKRLSAITRGDIQVLHARIGANSGHACANRVVDTVLSIFGKAIEWGYLKGENPAKVKRFKVQSRDRFLQKDELATFLAALEEEPNDTMKDYFWLSLLTGARKSNMLAMRWDEIRTAQGEWRIPMTKNGEAQVVPLVPQALAILERRREAVGGSEWVFPSEGKTGHLQDPKKAWKRLLTRAGITDLRLHDLRRSLGSWQAMSGSSPYIIGKSLGHKSHQATAVYARLTLDPVRSSMEQAVNAMLVAGGVAEAVAAEKTA